MSFNDSSSRCGLFSCLLYLHTVAVDTEQPLACFFDCTSIRSYPAPGSGLPGTCCACAGEQYKSFVPGNQRSKTLRCKMAHLNR